MTSLFTRKEIAQIVAVMGAVAVLAYGASLTLRALTAVAYAIYKTI